VVEADVVVVDVIGVGGPEYENWARPTRTVVLAAVQDAETVYVPGTHSQ